MDNITVVIKERHPYLSVFNNDVIGKPVEIAGSMAKLLDYVSTSINFSYSLKTNKAYGNCINGVWNGMIGMLRNGEADIAFTPTTMTVPRGKAIVFSQPVFTSDKTLLVGRPPLQQSLYGILSAFDSTASNLFVIGLFTTLLVSIICNKIVKRYRLGTSLSVIDQIWLLLEIVLSKSSINLPKRIWGRILLWSWMFPVMVITSLISSKLISALSTSNNFLQIKNIEDLLKYPKIQPLFSEGSSESDYFKFVTVSPFTDVWARATNMANSFRDAKELESDEILTEVERNKYVLINDRSTFESCLEDRYVKYKRCNFEITKPYLSSNLAIMFRKNMSATFTKKINVGILNMQQCGILDYLARKDLKNLDICLNFDSNLDQNDVDRGSINKFSGIFILWSMCIAICCGQLCVEIFVALVLKLLKRKNYYGINQKFIHNNLVRVKNSFDKIRNRKKMKPNRNNRDKFKRFFKQIGRSIIKGSETIKLKFKGSQ